MWNWVWFESLCEPIFFDKLLQERRLLNFLLYEFHNLDLVVVFEGMRSPSAMDKLGRG